MKVPRLEPNQGRAGRAALTLLLGLALGGGAQAGDAGPRHHAEGRFDAATAIYEVVAGDDLAAIAERFGVTVAGLKAENKLASDEIKVGQRLAIPAATAGGAKVQVTGFPGYNSIINKDKATIGRILKENGYATSWFGKDHNVPAFAASQVGPFEHWPIGQGFDYFYGFVGGDANQWQPKLFRNTTQIYPFEGKPEWNLITGMADDAIDYLNRVNQIDPSKPFFLYYVPGATHAPHHPTKEWVDKISAMHLFDQPF